MPNFTTIQPADYTRETEEAIEACFNYQPWTPEQIEIGKQVREVMASVVKLIVANIPACADRAVAIRKIREARMDVNSAITFNGKY